MKTINTIWIKKYKSKDIRFIKWLAKFKFFKSYDKYWRQYNLINSKPTTNFKTDSYIILNSCFIRYKFIKVKTDVNDLWFILIKFNNKADLYYLTNNDERFYNIKNKMVDHLLLEYSLQEKVRNKSSINDENILESTIKNFTLTELTEFIIKYKENNIYSFAYHAKIDVENLAGNELYTIIITKNYRYLITFKIDKLEKNLKVYFYKEVKDEHGRYNPYATVTFWKKEFEDFEEYVENFKPNKDYNLKISSNNFEYSKEVANYYLGLINE